MGREDKRLEMIQLVLGGQSDKEIAEHLDIKQRTVKSRRRAVELFTDVSTWERRDIASSQWSIYERDYGKEGVNNRYKYDDLSQLEKAIYNKIK